MTTAGRAALRRAARRTRSRLSGDATSGEDGSAVVEFLGVALLLLVPTVYLVLVLARMQSAAFAVDGGAREAVRAFTTAETEVAAGQRAAAAAGIALADQGLDPQLAADGLRVACDDAPCLSPGTAVTAELVVEVPLPGVPSFLHGVVPLSIPVSATATGVVDRFRAVG